MSLLQSARKHLLGIFSRLPGRSLGARLFWLWHLLAVVLLALLLSDWKVPRELPSDVHTPKPNRLSDVIQMGIWRGAWAHLVVSTLILLTVRWWARPVDAHEPIRLPQAAHPRPRWFWPLVVLAMVGALWLRWPRMSHSYWGDEGWALGLYVHAGYVPVDAQDLQGPRHAEVVPWRRVVFTDSTGGNHFLFSILQRLTLDAWRAVKGLDAMAFDECISRLPLLVAGLLSLPAGALFLRWLGRPGAGVAVAVFFALHPWHIRYSTEARGYILMLLLLILAVWALLFALQDRGRWRGWMALSLATFLAAYAWKVAALTLAAITGVVALGVLLNRASPMADRLKWVGRMVVANGTAAALFVFLYAPPALQSPRALEKLRHTGKPMGVDWVSRSATGLLVGTPLLRAEAGNPAEAPLVETLARRPYVAVPGVLGVVFILGLGIRRLWQWHKVQCLMWLAVIAAAAAGAAIFKWIMGIEWIYWYSFFAVLPIAVFCGIGWDSAIEGARRRWGRRGLAAYLLPLSAVFVVWPQIAIARTYPYENHREAFQLTRGQHEAWDHTGTSKVYTCYLWRHIQLYDPRADRYVRSLEKLEERMARAKAEDGELYYVVGQRDFFRLQQKDIMAVLEDPNRFEHLKTLWAEEPIHVLDVYRMKKP